MNKIVTISIAVVTVVGGTCFWLSYKRKCNIKRNRKIWDSVGKDVVILHSFPRGNTCLSLTPFSLKLETYLRMNNIKYVTEFKNFIGPKGKTPWITLNGKDVADSQLAIEYLAQHFQIDMSHLLSPKDRAVERAMRILMEDHLYWWGVIEKWIYGRGRSMLKLLDIPDSWLARFMFKRSLDAAANKMSQQAYMQGLGRHTREEVTRMGMEDIQALADYLGDKRYLMGNMPTEVDCTLFAFVALMKYAPLDPDDDDNSEYGSKKLCHQFPNLSEYCDRIKSLYYPDWDRILRLEDSTILH